MTAGMGDLSAKDRMKVVYEKGEAAVYSETEIVKTKVVVSCVGGLVEPRGWPDNIKGLEKFKGKVFHSARWDETIDFNDKNVVVVGTGCSSAQIVPSLPVAPYNAKSHSLCALRHGSSPAFLRREETNGGQRTAQS
jgi:cation diffusion facilitator CzcD-associated flavoprotein CzcO